MSTSASSSTPPAPLPTPPDFPVTWDSPEDAAKMWSYYKLTIFRDPITPLDFSLRIRTMDEGSDRGFAAYGMPFVTEERLINSYVYVSDLPPNLNTDELASLMAAAAQRVSAAMETMAVMWQETWLPEIQAHLAFWDGYDREHADLPTLLAHLTETEARLVQIWEVHNLVRMPTLLALSIYDDLYHTLLPDAPDGEAYQLLVGLDHKTIENSRELWKLSQLALTMPTVTDLLLAIEPADAPAQLTATEAGRAFWQQLTGYLQLFGKRNELMHLDQPSWCEEPAPVIKYLQNYLRQPDTDPEREQHSLIAEREALLSSVRQRLSTAAPEQVAQFESVYATAKTAVILNEDHNHWIEYQSYYYSRRVALAIGQRLVEQGMLGTVNDVFYLTLAELYPLAQAEMRTAAVDSYRGLVQERQRTAQRFANVTPPPVVGTMGDFAPLVALASLTDPLSLALFPKYSGKMAQLTLSPGELKGSPAALGTVRGKAKVVRSLSDIGKVEPGDILVAAVTTPSWTPLFASIAAVVTETGGILSHAAVVAREYRIPAVVGVQGATSLITDGQLIEVDGAAGIVRLLPSA